MPTPFSDLHMRGIVKRFAGVVAVRGVDFDVRAGEIHALLGENGAGKSTLMKLLYGLYTPDAGQIELNSETVHIRQPHDAIARGIGMIHQHFMLVPSLTVAENVALGLRSAKPGLLWRNLLDLKTVAADLRALSERYRLRIDPNRPVWQLAVGEQQRVEILRALYKGASLLILDEPTAVLTPQEVEGFFAVLRQMAAEGNAIIFISHKLHEVLEISSRITILRDGQKVGELPADEATRRGLAEMMVGRPILLEYQRPPTRPGEVRLELREVSALRDQGDAALRAVSLAVCAGEIVGVAGVSGNGQHELAQAVAGLRAVTGGQILLNGQDCTRLSPAARDRRGLAYIPEERMADGVIKPFTVMENYALKSHARPPFARAGLVLNRRAMRQGAGQAVRDYAIKTPDVNTPIRNLSGGNIQKLILARELARQPDVLIAAQPTRGVDIGASEYIHGRLLAERGRGAAVLLISEDLDEIRALSDRIAVMYEGQIIAVVPNDATLETHALGQMMAGVVPTHVVPTGIANVG